MSAFLTDLEIEIARLSDAAGRSVFYAARLREAGQTLEEFDLIDANGRLREKIGELRALASNISVSESSIAEGNDQHKAALEAYIKRAKTNLRLAKAAEVKISALQVPVKTQASKKEEKPSAPAEKKKPPKFSEIPKRMDDAVTRFNKNIPAIQKGMFDALMEEVSKLDLRPNGDIKATVANIKRIASIKNKLNRLILTDEYKAEVKEFARAFNDVTRLQNEYWRGVEATFKPRALLKQIRIQAIGDVVKNLTGAGLDSNVAAPLAEMLRSNITTGGSIKQLTGQLRESLLKTNTPGTLERYTRTYSQTAIADYSRQYDQIVSSDLNLNWFRYANSLIITSRYFCQAMRRPENQYFHVSMIPALLRAEGLFYIDEDGSEKQVPINSKTKLPDGFKAGTNASNFLINLGGWNCMHKPQPISEGLVPKEIRDRIKGRADYQRWARANVAA